MLKSHSSAISPIIRFGLACVECDARGVRFAPGKQQKQPTALHIIFANFSITKWRLSCARFMITMVMSEFGCEMTRNSLWTYMETHSRLLTKAASII